MISYIMRVGIIGAGFTGLSAAFDLQKKGHEVCLFEKESVPGGLAIGFSKDSWDWSLEKHYHHIFTTDSAIRKLADEVHHPFTFYRPNTSSLIDTDIIQLDSPLKLLQFPRLSFSERIRMAIVLGYLKYLANWKNLENEKAHEWLTKTMGEKGYAMLWEPLLRTKFGSYYKDISLAWFWARIKARSTELGYPEKGFQGFAEHLADIILRSEGTIEYNTTVTNIVEKDNKAQIAYQSKGKKHTQEFDVVIVTIPNLQFAGLASSLPETYKKKLRDFKGIGAVNMVLELKKPFLPNHVYWLSICDQDYPFLAVVEHTNFIDKKYYDNKHIVYVGNYLPHGHNYFSMQKDDLLKEYDPYLQKLHPDYQKNIINTYIFKEPFAQPIVTPGFSKHILPFETPIPHVYLANMQQVYPWDRGTNFAVKMGREVAQLIHGKIRK